MDPALEATVPEAEPREETREEREARAHFDRLKEITDLGAILADKRVRDFLWRIISRCGMFSETFTPNASISAHNAGRAAAGRMIWAEIEEANYEALMQMLVDGREQRLAESADAEKGSIRSDPEG